MTFSYWEMIKTIYLLIRTCQNSLHFPHFSIMSIGWAIQPFNSNGFFFTFSCITFHDFYKKRNIKSYFLTFFLLSLLWARTKQGQQSHELNKCFSLLVHHKVHFNAPFGEKNPFLPPPPPHLEKTAFDTGKTFIFPSCTICYSRVAHDFFSTSWSENGFVCPTRSNTMHFMIR